MRKKLSHPPEKIVWCYGIYQTHLENYLEFIEGLPELSILHREKCTLLIIDDMMVETDDHVAKIFTKISHPMNISALYLTQNLFFGEKQNRTIALNTHYLRLFKNFREKSHIKFNLSNVSREVKVYDRSIS